MEIATKLLGRRRPDVVAVRVLLLEPAVARIESGHPALVRTARLLARALGVQVADLQRQPPES
jgi:hypothetical protein